MPTALGSTPAPHLNASPDALPPLWFVAPEGFFALPIAATPAERTERARSLVRELYSRGDANIWEPAAPYYEAIAEMMGDVGLSYAAMGLFSAAEDADDGTPLTNEPVRHEPSDGVVHCAFTVGIIQTDHTGENTDVVAQGILTTLSGDPYNDAIWLDLPCGPAVSCISVREYRLTPEMTATGEETKLLTGQIQAHIPFPTGPYTAVLTLYTASMEHWASVYHLMSAVLQTVSFTDPLEALPEEPA
ncbi:hypothetical protein ACFW5X_02750 [Streptomyces albogriseolus]|uniref:hypothetical protein n=1 Tax=Streptomyces TaxID=1883 RepID=UPI002A757F96|nr:hypothetical protein [Streptomyces sp. CL7]WPP31339.1 hypothetical protein SJH97_19335 [Streptomyces sp. CL7]